MLFFTGKEEMGLEANLKLLDLAMDATIDDANQSYAHLHKMIDRFHKDADAGERGDRHKDVELLTCAYEKAVAYISDRDSGNLLPASSPSTRSSAVDETEPTDLHFTINFSADALTDGSHADVPVLPEPNNRTVEEAISITTRRLHQTESALPGAQQAVKAATEAMAAANRQYQSAKQASLIAIVDAKTAKTRALLMEIEAKRTMDDAIAVAEKARARVVAARRAAREAMAEADQFRDQVRLVKKSEETAAAETVCAEDRLEKEKVRLKALTCSFVEARRRMKMFQDSTGETQQQAPGTLIQDSTAVPDNGLSSPQAVNGNASAGQQILNSLLEIEESLEDRDAEPIPSDTNCVLPPGDDELVAERRRHCRLIYPTDRRPMLSIDGRPVPIIDLSSAGIRLEQDDDIDYPRIVRGTIAFDGRQPMKVACKVVRNDEHGLGLKLVTRIGNHILDQERLRLSA